MIPRFSYECNRVLSQQHPATRNKSDYVRVSDVVALLERMKLDNEGLDYAEVRTRVSLIEDIAMAIGEPMAQPISV